MMQKNATGNHSEQLRLEDHDTRTQNAVDENKILETRSEDTKNSRDFKTETL